MCAELYNANLESWRGAYAWWKEHHNPEVESFPFEWNLSLYDRMMMPPVSERTIPNGSVSP